MIKKPLTVVSVYNRYLNRGGEDEVFEGEAALLESYGHRVIRVTEQVRTPAGLGERLSLALNTLWSRSGYKMFQELLRTESVDVVHVHNYFPNLSPSIFFACQQAGVPVLHTLHNYRPFCLKNTCFRDSKACEDCLGKRIPWPGIAHACYHGSRAQTGLIALMLMLHRWLKTWQKRVSTYITLTEFARQKFVQAGLPAEKVVVKPNFIHTDPGPGKGNGDYALFVGRLSQEKGISTLLAAWQRLGNKFPLKVIGDGPLVPQVAEVAQQSPGLEWLGRQSNEQVLDLMSAAQVLVFPSEWYEGFPIVIVEAFASGLPVLSSNLGSMSLLIEHGRTGLHFRPGDAEDLATQVEWLLSHPQERAQMRQAARAEFEAKYTAERNYQTLMEIYEAARAQVR